MSVDGLTWLRSRAYDAATRAFLSPDPLPPVPGEAWSANPYHYAANDPIGWADPLGRRPLSEADMARYREAHRSPWERATDWVQDNWEYIAAGAMVVAGVAVMATGIGGPIGAAMIAGALISAGGSTAVQKHTTGGVDWGQVAIAGIVGGAAGGAGAAGGLAIGGASRLAAASPAGRGAMMGTADKERWPDLVDLKIRYRGSFAYVSGDTAEGSPCRCSASATWALPISGLRRPSGQQGWLRGLVPPQRWVHRCTGRSPRLRLRPVPE